MVFAPVRPFAAVAALAHIAVFAAGVWNLRLGFFCRALYENRTKKGCCALTFDDGPDPDLTPDILDALDRYGFTATFFCIGRNVEKHPALAREIVKRGHTIGCHDLDHKATANFRLRRAMVQDISRANNIIFAATGRRPVLYRPPVGLSNPHLASALASLDMLCIGWKHTLRDSGNRRASHLERMERLCSDGAVIILHDTLPKPHLKELFLKNLEKLLRKMAAQGLRSVSVGQLFEVEPYRSEQKG